MSQKPKQKISASTMRTGAESNSNWSVIAVCLFLATAVWLVFGQTLHFQFINFDDNAYIYKNPQVTRGLSLEGFVWAFTHVHSNNWHPLTWLTHMLDSELYGLNPGGHHLTNVLLHAATAILLFLVLRQTTGALWRSAFVAAVFAIHPLRVESVAWVAERKDVLSGLFFVLTIGAYARYARLPWSPFRYALVLLCLALGLMSKPMLVTMPLVLLLLDVWPLQRIPRTLNVPMKLIWEKLPFVALAAASCVVTLIAQRSAMPPVARFTLPLRIGNALIAYVDYLRQMFYPTNLAILYPWDAARISGGNIALSLTVLLVVTAAVIFLRQRRFLLMGWLWYLIMLLPVIGILQVGNQAQADRYTYLPQIGLYLLLAWGIADLCARLRYRTALLTGVASIILISLTYLARAQTAYWHDSESVWSHALACTTDNVVAEQNLGEAYHVAGKTREAIEHFERALRIEPRDAAVHSSMGVFYLEMGDVKESLRYLQKALELEPNFDDAHYNLGNTYLQMGRASDAIYHYDKALERNPDDTEALNNLAWILATWPDATQRDGRKALVLAERADSLTRRQNQIIEATLAAAYAEVGRFADAKDSAEHAIQLAIREGNQARADSIRAQRDTYASGSPMRDTRFPASR